MWSLSLLAQQATSGPGPSWSDISGPLGALALAMLVIGYLVKQLAEERKARNELAERLVDQAERIIPVLEANTAALRRADRDQP